MHCLFCLQLPLSDPLEHNLHEIQASGGGCRCPWAGLGGHVQSLQHGRCLLCVQRQLPGGSARQCPVQNTPNLTQGPVRFKARLNEEKSRERSFVA